MERPDLHGVKCEYCQHCFAFAADLMKHVIAKHYVGLGKPKPEFHCTSGNCSRVYTRSDHLYRHGVKKHGWQAGGTRNRRRAVNGGQQT